MDFDPSQVSYEELLEVFWKSHNPARNSWSKQYMAAVFYHNEGQKDLIEKTLKAIESKTGKDVETKVLPYREFYLAEDYHQKHALQRYPEVMDELRAVYPSYEDFLSSSAVTLLNGYLGGYGSCEDLKEDAQVLGLSQETVDTLSKVVCGKKGVVSCPVPGKVGGGALKTR